MKQLLIIILSLCLFAGNTFAKDYTLPYTKASGLVPDNIKKEEIVKNLKSNLRAFAALYRRLDKTANLLYGLTDKQQQAFHVLNRNMFALNYTLAKNKTFNGYPNNFKVNDIYMRYAKMVTLLRPIQPSEMASLTRDQIRYLQARLGVVDSYAFAIYEYDQKLVERRYLIILDKKLGAYISPFFTTPDISGSRLHVLAKKAFWIINMNIRPDRTVSVDRGIQSFPKYLFAPPNVPNPKTKKGLLG
jgi:hypothetical protein